MLTRRKNDFLAMLSHELRNSLGAMNNATAITKHESHANPRTMMAVNLLDRQTAQMTRLLNDLLDLARINRDRINLRREEIDLRTGVEDSVLTVQPMIEKKLQRLAVRSYCAGKRATFTLPPHGSRRITCKYIALQR